MGNQTEKNNASASFTKGKWILDEEKSIIRSSNDTSKNGGVDIICQVYCGFNHITTIHEAKANARLIASAPELLLACQNALSDIQRLNKRLIKEGKHEYVLMEKELHEAICLAGCILKNKSLHLITNFDMETNVNNTTEPQHDAKLPVSGSLRIAAQKLLDAVGKHHPVMAMDTQLDLYMAYHEVKEALSNDR